MESFFYKKVERNDVNSPLIDEIESYVKVIIKGEIPQIPFSSYVNFYKNGIREEFERVYFERRKQFTALALYLQWNDSKDVIDYFKEVLWSISNEFSWCLVAHLPFEDNNFGKGSVETIDLFAAETAQSLCEILIIHEDKLDLLLVNHIKRLIKARVIEPFINNKWHWETATHNWSAVCGSCIGIVALLMEEGERQELILQRVDKALEYYISGFGDDGVTLEGIGYWVYGFGYYIYYMALREELFKENNEKIRSIANLPEVIQISKSLFLPFSDSQENITIPTGLMSYLTTRLSINPPLIEKISDFAFEHCYRWAHISRNLWWTSNEIFNRELSHKAVFLLDAQWLIYRDKKMFFAIKGGSNDEPHNHNDMGNFIIAINGEEFLCDLGAGPYTAGYFGNERYTYPHTRSYWHSVPFIDYTEQGLTEEMAKVIKKDINDKKVEVNLDISKGYPGVNIEELYRKATFYRENNVLVIEDYISSSQSILLNEGFISYIRPRFINNGEILWQGKYSKLMLEYDYNKFDYHIEEKKISNHYNEEVNVYRVGLVAKFREKRIESTYKFSVIEGMEFINE